MILDVENVRKVWTFVFDITNTDYIFDFQIEIGIWKMTNFKIILLLN